MTFMAIDPDGKLTMVVTPVSTGLILDYVSPPGTVDLRMFDDIALRDGLPLRGFCNARFQALDLPRNPIGAVVLAVLGAPMQVYAGTIVIAGWDAHDPDEPLADLADDEEGLVYTWHRAAADGGIPWLASYADHVLQDPFPGRGAIATAPYGAGRP